MGVTRQPVVQPRLRHHRLQGCLGRHGVQEVQRVRHELAERHGADWIGLVSPTLYYMGILVFLFRVKIRFEFLTLVKMTYYSLKNGTIW